MKRPEKPWVFWILVLVLALAFPVAVPTTHAQSAPSLFQQSYDLEAENKLAESLAVLERIPAGSQGYVYHFRRGWLLYLLGRHADAVASYERAITRSSATIEARLGLMLPQMALRRWVDVEKTALAVLERDSLNYLATSRLAWSHYNLGRWEDAAAVYRRVLTSYPSDVEMRAGLGWSLLKQGKAAEATVEFRAVLEIAPRHAIAREGLQAAGVPK